MILGLVGVLLLFAGIQSRMNKRKWAAQMAYLEMISATENNNAEVDQMTEIPEPILEMIDNSIDRYEEEDIELV